MHMFGVGGSTSVALGQLAAAVDALTELDLSRLDRDELLELLRGD